LKSRHHRQLNTAALLLGASILAASMPLLAVGAYALTEKPFSPPLIKELPKSQKVNVDATQIVFDPRTDIATATGSVTLEYGPYTLTATKVVFNRKTNILTANGSVVLKEPRGNVAEADTMSMDIRFRDGFATHLKALLNNDATITAQYAKRRDGEITVFEKATYTACKDCQTRSGEPLWQLVTERTIHDQKRRTLKHFGPRLQISGVTVAGFPYLELPDPGVKRRTGFLIPSIKATNVTGYGVVVPYYWAPAPNYDVTLRPWFTYHQGPVADIEWRHRLETGSYSVRGYGVHQFNPDEGSTIGDQNTWRGGLKTKGRFNIDPDWDWGWDGLVSSDRTFLRNYTFSSERIAANNLFLTGLWDQTYISAQAFSFQTLSAGIPSEELPFAMPYLQIEHTLPQTILGGSVELSMNSYSLWRENSATPFTDVSHASNQSRLITQALWRKENTLQSGQLLTTFARLRGDLYVTENLPSATAGDDNDVIARVLPAAGVDMRWPFISSNSIGSHVITPVAQVIAATDETETDNIGNEDSITVNFDHTSLFLEDRFTGLDRYEGGVRANLGVNYNLLRPDGSFIRASIGESFHLAGENSFSLNSGLGGSKSDIVAGVTVSPWEGIDFNYEARIEEDLSQLNRQEARIGLSLDSFSANATYLYLNDEPEHGRPVEEEFLQANARLGLGDGWYLTGQMTYDLETEYFRNRGIGLEFDCQCMNAKLSYSQSRSNRTSDIDHRIFLSFDLATLGGSSFSLSD
jgi:LPS-assembly protein